MTFCRGADGRAPPHPEGRRLDSQEELTDALSVQVRRAVELLVAAIGRADVAARQRGEPGLEHLEAHEVYRGAVTVLMRVVFLLFAEDRGLLPAGNELYQRDYSALRLGAALEQRALDGGEEDLERSCAAWHRLLDLFGAVYHGVSHPGLRMRPHGGALFDPERLSWLPASLDDRTVLHVLRAVQQVTVGRGRNAERRMLSFRTLDVEQIGYLYEGLLSCQGRRADQVVVGLLGQAGPDMAVPLTDLETLAARSPDVPSLAAALAVGYPAARTGAPRTLEKLLTPLTGIDREQARQRLLAVTGNDWSLAERLLPFAGVLRADLRGLPMVTLPGGLYVTRSALRRNTGTHYTPRYLAEEVVEHALEPLVYSPGPVHTADRDQWQPIRADQILALNVADIAMGSAAFLIAAARYLGGKLLDAWLREGDERVRADHDHVVIEARRQIIEHCLYGVDINPLAVEMARLSLWLFSMDPERPFTFIDDRLVCGDALLGSTTLDQRTVWRATDQLDGAFTREPLHWPLAFPEVFERGGFDAVVGNPPFLGGKKISGACGPAYREYLVDVVGRGVKGNADLIAYFLLRAHDLLGPAGQTGLIATNTLAQGDTREVGLDQLVADGVTIRRAVKSKPWPSKCAVLEYCAVWTSRAPLGAGAQRTVDGVTVAGIAPSLDPLARLTGNPRRLQSNAGISYQGSNVLGLGFTMEPGQAAALIVQDPRNAEVLFPYLNGQDLNSQPDCSARRWVIDFRELSAAQARYWPAAWQWVETYVKPERMTKDRVKYPRMVEQWWKHWNSREKLYSTIAGLPRVIVITLVSKTVMPVMVPAGQVFAHKLGVFATDDPAMLALLSSAPHYWWTLRRSSTMKTDINYSPSDVVETLPFPDLTPQMRELGERLDTYRRDIMLSRQAGLTMTYNLIHDPSCADGDLTELRTIHRMIDEATVHAYGWHDLHGELDHGFHPAGRETRYTIGPVAQREILDRLLELNHQRYAAEVVQGLHHKRHA